MNYKLTRVAFAVAVVALLALAISGPKAAGQAQNVNFTDRLEKNTIRSSMTKTSSNVRTAYLYDGNETGAQRTEGERQYAMQEYVAEASDGRPTKLYRSYDQFGGKDIMRVTEDGQPIETPATDTRSRQTFVYSIDSSGNFTLANELLQVMDEKGLHAAASDNTPMLAPSAAVKAGDSWEVSARDFGFVGLLGAEEKISEAEISATLEGVKENDAGLSVATLSFKASLKSNYRTVNSFDGSETANLNAAYSITGSAAYLVGGRMLSFQAAGEATAKGKANTMDCAITVSYTMAREFSYGALLDVAADNGSEGPTEAADLYTAKLDQVPENQIVIARAGSIGRLQTFDPSSRKIVKTVAALPKGVDFNDVALSKDRKRIAFRSNGNNQISIAEANVFVLELESGVLNQITPNWATNEGIAKPLDTGKTCTITGRLVWYDDEFKRERSDGLNIGWVRVDHTHCFSPIDSTTGKFKLENVPSGTSILLQAYANLPNYSSGKSRGWQFSPSGKATASTVMLTDGDKDIGDFKINPPAGEHGYGSPSFAKGGDVVCNRYPGASIAIVGYPKRTWKAVDVDANLGLLTGGMSVSPDAQMLSFVVDSAGGNGSIHFYGSNGKELWGTGLAEGVEVSFRSQSAWLADSSGWVCTAGAPGWLGKDRFGMPGLIYASPAKKQVTFARKWPQLGGYACKSIALNKEGTIAYLVFHFTNEKGVTYGDLWQWDSTTDTLSRLTNLGDVLNVASIGR